MERDSAFWKEPGMTVNRTEMTLTGVIRHQLLKAAELCAGGNVEAAIVQLADLVVLHIEALGVVKI